MTNPEDMSEDEAREYCLSELLKHTDELEEIMEEEETADYRQHVVRLCVVFIQASLTKYQKDLRDRN